MAIMKNHKEKCKCIPCLNSRNEKHKNTCNCMACRMIRGETKGINNPMFGKSGEDSPNFGKKFPEHSKRISGENHPNFGKIGKNTSG